MPSKYDPLGRALRRASGSKVRFSFKEIETILGFDLPRSARTYAPWWANVGGSHVQAEAWMGSGWRSCQVDVPGEQVSFERVDAAETAYPAMVEGMEEGEAAFLHRETPATAVVIDRNQLSGAARRMLQDYCESEGCELDVAIVNILNDLALARRRQLIDWVRANAPHVPGDSTDIIREARDAR